MSNRTTPRVLVVAVAVLLVAAGLGAVRLVGDDRRVRVAVVDDGSTSATLEAVRARLADEHDVVVVASGGVDGRDASAGGGRPPDVVVVGLDVGPVAPPDGTTVTTDGTTMTTDGTTAAPMPGVDVGVGALGAERLPPTWASTSCVVGVVPVTIDDPGSGPGASADASAGASAGASGGPVPAGVTVVVDPGHAIRADPAGLVAPDGTSLSDAGVERYAELVDDGVRACTEVPVELALTSTEDAAAGVVRLTWPDAELRRAVQGTSPEEGAGAVTYEVEVLHEGVRRGAPRRADGPAVDVPAEVFRFPAKATVAVRVVALRPDGLVRVAAGSTVRLAPFDRRSVDVGPPLAWTATPPTVLVGDRERRAEGLATWVDGTIGFVEVDGAVRALGANGGAPARWTVGGDRFLGEVLDPGTPIQGLADDVHYAAGGPVHRDEASGALLLFYHGEKLPDGDASRYWSYVGLAVSRDDGATFRDLGPVVTPSVAFGDPAFDGPIEVGGAPFVIRDGHFQVYFRDVVAEVDHHRGLNLAVARAPVDDVVRAALSGGQTTWTKYGELGWDQPGLGGRPAEVLPGAPHPNWFDVAHLADHDLYVLVASHGSYLDWTLWVATSRDGVHWRRPEAFWKDAPGTEALYVSISSPDRTSQRVVEGDLLHVYRTRSTVAEGLGHRWDGDVTIERMDLRLESAG